MSAVTAKCHSLGKGEAEVRDRTKNFLAHLASVLQQILPVAHCDAALLLERGHVRELAILAEGENE